jgi:hypothetical protein
MTSGSKAKQFKIVSMTGAEIINGTLGGFTAVINTEKLTAGTYVLEVTTMDGSVSYQTLVKR